MKFIFFTSLLLLSLVGNSQVVSRSTISSGGDHFEQTDFSLSVTIGEFSGFSYFENECLSISTGVQHADEFVPCFGDFDFNHEINVSDLLLLNANYGLTGICIDGDLDQDQKVKVSDVLIFFGAYGGVCD
jgi:hypothetical protein